MSELGKNIIDVAVAEEMEAAATLLASEQQEKARQQQEAERLALEAKRAEQQALFRKEIEPAIRLVQTLSKNGLTDPDFVHIEDQNNAFRINTGIPLGCNLYAHFITPKGREQELRNEKYRSRNYYRSEYEEREERIEEKKAGLRTKLAKTATLKMQAPETKTAPSQLPEEYKDSKDAAVKLGPFFQPYNLQDMLSRLYSEFVYDRFSWELYSRETRYGNDGIKTHGTGNFLFLGTTFERGQTTSKDVNDFITTVVQKIYANHRDNPEKLETLRKVLRTLFDIDLEAVKQSAQMLVVARDFTASADADIQIIKPTTTLDLSALEKTDKDIREEIDKAVNSKDALAILKIGSDVLDLSRGLISELAGDLLPAAIGDDYALLRSIRRDIEALKPANPNETRKTLGQRLLGNFIGHQRSVAKHDPNASVSTNFSALSASLKQRREVVERRVVAVQSKSEAIQKLCDIIGDYKDALDCFIESETDAVKKTDLVELRQIFAISAIASHSGRVGIESAVSSEKKAFIAIQKTANAIPLLASSLIQAINKMRAEQSDRMLQGAEQATQSLLENLSQDAHDMTKKTGLPLREVFEIAEKHVVYIEGHVTDAAAHLKESEDAIQRSAIEAQKHLMK